MLRILVHGLSERFGVGRDCVAAPLLEFICVGRRCFESAAFRDRVGLVPRWRKELFELEWTVGEAERHE